MVLFPFFKMAAAAMSDFEKFKFLMVEKVKKVEMRNFAKFRRNRSNGAEICDFQYYAS